MIRVRFAPSPTGYLHIGSARTFIFNWLFVRKHQGTMVLRIDDTDLDRNSEASLNSIYEGLNWLGLGWDEFYRQSDRLDLHRKVAYDLLERGLAYRDFTPASDLDDRPHSEAQWLCNPEMRSLSKEQSDARAAAGEPFVIRFRVERDAPYEVEFHDQVYGPQSKLTADIEDFALLRSNGMPTYHLASCADDIDLRISHIVRGQDHLSNTFKHVLIFQAAAERSLPQFAHLPLLIGPDGSKLSKRRHGPVVSVTTYRDHGFLALGYINFLCLLGWSPKDNREQMSLYELTACFSFEGVNRSNAVVNFSEEDPIDPKALWLNSQHLRTIPVGALAPLVRQTLEAHGLTPYGDDAFFAHVVDTIRSRFSTLLDFSSKGRAYFSDDYPIEPQALEKLNAPGARELLRKLADRIEANPEFTESSVEADLRKLAEESGVKAGLLINASRAALTGQTVGPSAFAVFTCIGRERVIQRLRKV